MAKRSVSPITTQLNNTNVVLVISYFVIAIIIIFGAFGLASYIRVQGDIRINIGNLFGDYNILNQTIQNCVPSSQSIENVYSLNGTNNNITLLASQTSGIFQIACFNCYILIHESDTIPGKVNKWAGRFARRIAISYPEAGEFFPKEKCVITGNPVMKPQHKISNQRSTLLKTCTLGKRVTSLS